MDTMSSQDSAFKKEDDVRTPSLPGPGELDLGFPLSSKRGTTEGLGNVSKKKMTPTDAASLVPMNARHGYGQSNQHLPWIGDRISSY